MTQVVPKEIAFAVAKMDWNVNSFRLETNGATSAGPSSIITLSLPQATIDLRSFKVHFDIATTSDATSTNVIYGKLPADTSSLIQQCEIYCSGIQIASLTEFNVVSRIKKVMYSSRDAESSIDHTLSHGAITTGEAIDTVSAIFKPKIGIFAESSTRYIPTNLTGDWQIRLTMAPNQVLAYKEHGVALSANFSDAAARTAALNVTYSISSIHASINTCTLGDFYESMLLERLTQEDYLSVNYKDYYCFSQHGNAATSHDVRFSLSASSIDRLYTVCRDGNSNEAGIKARALPGAALTDANTSNHLHFKSFNSSTSTRGTLRYQYSCNNVMHPQYQADILDAGHECTMCSDSHGFTGRGNMITGLQDFNVGKCVLPLQLQMPGQTVHLMSGLNSRGNNTQFSVAISGQVVPTADADAQVTASISTLVVVETTSQLRIAGAKQISVSH
jgi:hypothetical protein